MPESFGTRLRQHRESRAVSLTAIAEQTKIKRSVLEALERDDVSRWPSGLYRRAFLRAYAQAIGLAPEPLVREFVSIYPDPTEEIPTTRVSGEKQTGDRPHANLPEPFDLDLSAVADLCTALARAQTLAEMTPLLQRAVGLLDAVGLMLWIWDPQVSALGVAAAHGYSEQLLAQVPRVQRENHNAIAQAFRSTRLAVVDGRNHTPGALAAPLTSGTGCLGVVAVELSDGRERASSVQALLTIVAAQLAMWFESKQAVDVSARRLA